MPALQGEMMACRGYLVPAGTQNVTTIVSELDIDVAVVEELTIGVEIESI